MNRTELKEILDRIGWSQAELARRIGMNPGSVSRWKTVPGAAAAYVRLIDKVRESGK